MSEYKLVEGKAIARQEKDRKICGCGVLRVSDSCERHVEVT